MLFRSEAPKKDPDGLTRHDRRNIVEALDGSLKRLNTVYLDLYQLHWPDRATNFFGQRDYPYADDTHSTAIEETLSVLADQVKAGKVRQIGVSNETPWGVAEFLKQSERLGLPKIASIQNPYSLLNRLFEGGLSEFTHREGVGLLAYSPLAFVSPTRCICWSNWRRAVLIICTSRWATRCDLLLSMNSSSF